MNGTIEEPEPASLKHPPGTESLTEAELNQLAKNLELREEVREVFRGELAWRRLQEAIKPQAVPIPPERVLEVQCRDCPNRFPVRLRLLKGVKFPADFRYTCKECAGDQSVLDTPTSEIEELLEGKSPGQKRRVYEVLASTRASRGPYIVEYPNGQFEYSEGGYKPYRREKVRETNARWRKNKKKRQAEYKRRYRKGDRRQQFRAVPVDSNAADAAWEAKLKEFDFACSSCKQPLSLETAIRWREGATYVPVCASCLGKKAAATRWAKEKKVEK